MEFEVLEKQRREKKDTLAKIQHARMQHGGGGKAPHRRWSATISRGAGASAGAGRRAPSMATNDLSSGNIYSQALPQMDMDAARSPPRPGKPARANGAAAPADPALTAHLDALVREYLTASGGTATARDVGRYLAANRSLRGNLSALAELKGAYGNLSNFIRKREGVFSKPDMEKTSADYPVTLL